MKAFKATFVKKNGEERTMKFVKLEHLSTKFLKENIKGNGKERFLPLGQELVYDLDLKGWRIFNWKTQKGEVKEFEIENM